MPRPILFGLTQQMRQLGVPPFMHCLVPLCPTVLTIAGVTKDETGAPAGGYTVYLFNMASGLPVLAAMTVSDGAGAYAFSVGSGMPYWAVSYKAGAPDKTGATLNTLVGA